MELCSSSEVTTTTAEATEDQKSESRTLQETKDSKEGVVPSSDVDATTAVDDETASPIIKVSAHKIADVIPSSGQKDPLGHLIRM